MNELFRWLLFGWIAGFGFPIGLIGIGGISIVALLRPRPRRFLPRILTYAALPLVALSAVALPGWLYIAYAGIAIFWCEVERRAPEHRLLLLPRATAALASVALLVVFTVWQIPPRVPLARGASITVLSTQNATSDGNARSWPQTLGLLLDATVDERPFSFAQDDAIESSLASKRKGVVIVDIGPHRLLSRITANEMQRRLERLFEELSRQERSAVMLELPLGPLENRFGEVQRAVARRHHVALAPRWILAHAWLDADSGPRQRESAARFLAQQMHDVLRSINLPSSTSK
jgi:hypothetical protein